MIMVFKSCIAAAGLAIRRAAIMIGLSSVTTSTESALRAGLGPNMSQTRSMGFSCVPKSLTNKINQCRLLRTQIRRVFSGEGGCGRYVFFFRDDVNPCTVYL